MDKVYHKQYNESISDRIAAAKMNALAIAAPLSDDTVPTSVSSAKPAAPEPEQQEKKQKDIPNQKLGLLTALLSVGALRPSVAILTKFPWMTAAYSELTDLYLRILRVSMQPLYETACHTNTDLVSSNTKPRARFGSNGAVQPPQRKHILTICAPTPPSTVTSEFVFFYPTWDAFIPRCTQHSDIADVLVPLLTYLSTQISRDMAFVTKLCRIGRLQLTAEVSCLRTLSLQFLIK